MDFSVKLKQIALLIGDALLLYCSLAAALFLRYGGLNQTVINDHFWPFTIIFSIWLITFYIAGLYDLRSSKNDLDFSKKFFSSIAINALIAIVLFYLVPIFGISPKTNLFSFLIIFGLAAYVWRTFYNNLLSAGSPPNKVLLIGYNQTVEELVHHVQQNPQLGYKIAFWMKEGLQDKELDHLSQIILNNKINLIVIPAHIKKNSKAARLIYRNLVLGLEVLDLAALYEKIFKKLPLAELEEVWFLENLAKSHKVYEFFKRPIEIFLAAILCVVLLPLGILLAILIALTSAGPVVFRQTRSGKNEHEFQIYKFRTMKADAEKQGPQWSSGSDDQRVTAIGKILRRAHLDELPQLINILGSELSFVGPRPERPEFIKQLRQDIPYYEMRHLIRPGITGWAQINYRYGASIEDAYEKLQYDLYYLKNRSLVLDILIILRTLKLLFVSAK